MFIHRHATHVENSLFRREVSVDRHGAACFLASRDQPDQLTRRMG